MSKFLYDTDDTNVDYADSAHDAMVHICQLFFRMVFVLFSRFFYFSETYECNTTPDWLNHTV